MQETRTSLAPAEVLQRAKTFFARHVTIYSAFIEQESATHVTMRGQGGEEVVVSVVERDGATLVTAASYIFDAQIGRFFSTLPPAAESDAAASAPALPAEVVA